MAGFVIGLFGISSSGAQDKSSSAPPTPGAAPAAPKVSDFSKEAIVFDKLYVRVREQSDGTGSRQATARIHVLSDAGVKELAVLTFTYTASNQQIEIGYVRVVKPDGTVVVTPDYNVQDLPADVTRSAPMYSDIHQKHVAVKGLGVGDTLEYQVTLNTMKPEVPGQFWFEYSFQKKLIIFDEVLDLDLPADRPVNVASAEVQPTVSTVSGRKLYHWTSSNLVRPDPEAPTKSTKHWKPSVQATTFASWEQVGAWYQSLQSGSLAVSPAIQSKALTLTKGLTSDQEKVRAIFNDVALHIHYVGLDFGIGRYQPHYADDVLSNEYGDCKDKHTLLATLLKAVGIEATPVLLSNSRELDPATPSPAQFDHVITLVNLDGKALWMDSTAETAPIGVLLGPLRDKQGLAVPPTGTAHLERTPANLPTPALYKYIGTGQLDEQGHFTGHLEETLEGDISVVMRNAFRRTPEAQWKELLQNVMRGQRFGGEISNPRIEGIEQPDQPFRAAMDYSREKYFQWNDADSVHWIDAPMPPMGGELAPGIKQIKPIDEPELGVVGSNVYETTLSIPKNWTLAPPPNADAVYDWAEYHSQYSFKDGVFHVQRTLIVRKNRVPLEDWEKYLAFRRAMFDDENHQSLLEPPGMAKHKHH